MPLSIIILIAVLFFITIRNFLPFNLPIWLIMFLGAVGVLLTQQISILSAIHSIDIEIILYLFGVFILAEALESSGVLEHFTEKVFNYNQSIYYALFIIIFLLGLSAALLMNDAVAIIGTPIILQLCRKQEKLAGLLLIVLAYAVTIGSVLSPVGNPQNLLIAIKGNMAMPFVDFFIRLCIPTLINLAILFGLIFLVLKMSKKTNIGSISQVTPLVIGNQRYACMAKLSFCLFVLLIILKIILSFFTINFDFAAIALISALPIIVFGKNNKAVFKNLDWGTLLFFIGMFILMQSVWESGFFQAWIEKTHFMANSMLSIFAISSILSQFISNVPLVALYIPLLQSVDAHVSHYLALAAGSTLAGNIYVFGAASNMIIIQNAEKRGFKKFNIVLFSLLGIPLTVINIAVYAFFLS